MTDARCDEHNLVYVIEGDRLVCPICQVVEALARELEQVRGWLEWVDFVKDEACRYDHRDYCQAHNLDERPCPMEAIRRYLHGPAGDEPGSYLPRPDTRRHEATVTVAQTLRRLYPQNPDIVFGREARVIVEALEAAGLAIVRTVKSVEAIA